MYMTRERIAKPIREFYPWTDKVIVIYAIVNNLKLNYKTMD